MMNIRVLLIALSTSVGVLSLILFISVMGGMASNASGVATNFETVTVIESYTGSALVPSLKPNINRNESLSQTKPISIYLPLMEYDFIDPSAERDALMALYHHTNGDRWRNNTGWGTDTPYCDWYHITCDENEHVMSIRLGGNMLTGTLPSEIGNLPKLTELVLYGTAICDMTSCVYYQISGPIPPEIGKLTELTYLDLTNNQFTSLTPEIGNLTCLLSLRLHTNQLAFLPPEIGNLANLQELGLVSNKLTSLPTEIGNLTTLQNLYLNENQLTSLPLEIGNLVNLKDLRLNNNQLTSLPLEIGNLESLQLFDMTGNRITSLPPQVGNLANLQGLILEANQLTSLPPQIGNLASLQALFLDNNRLAGIIPSYLSNLNNLSSLDLSQNPDLTCWETQEAVNWALSLDYYVGPTCIASE
jgi:Leucine-rich repeat (LRR) protein